LYILILEGSITQIRSFVTEAFVKKGTGKAFEELVGIMERLRAPKDGCPWDLKQTHKSLLKYMYEEADEVARAVRRRDWENFEEELGDLLLQIVFQAEMARQGKRFDIKSVIEGISKKMVRRHPHIFGKKKCKTPGQVLKQWAEIKAAEKAGKKKNKKRA